MLAGSVTPATRCNIPEDHNPLQLRCMVSEQEESMGFQ